MNSLKITTVGNSAGVVLSREILRPPPRWKGRLPLRTGDTERHRADFVQHPEFTKLMETAEKVMREDRNVLRKLGE